MNWQSVVSSNVSRIGYNSTTSELGVEFNSGRTYIYIGVPESVYRQFLSASSKGSFVHTDLKDRYPTR